MAESVHTSLSACLPACQRRTHRAACPGGGGEQVEAVKQRLALMEVDQALESRIMKYYQVRQADWP